MALPEVLVSDLQSAGYYPQLTQGILAESLFGEPVLAHFVHIDTHVDIESIHRHVTAFVLTETRLLLAHVDDDPNAAPGSKPKAVTSSEDIELERLGTVMVGRTYADPAAYQPGDKPVEVSLTLSWGAARRIEAFPEACGDPNCMGDHGYGGSIYSEDVMLRVSAEAEGQDAVDRIAAFSAKLRAAVFQARLRSRR
ncbi:DUF5998 family protein [Brevibacterium sp.]|uniref:DUF5998 family protein n=1 Tax=Brevibacterium sp. TaxID=1701 RepID=UPI002811ABCB|nr:DUF5998 family protein [Brevibacterium sp.]